MAEHRYEPTESASEPTEMRWQVAASILGWTVLAVFLVLFAAFASQWLTLFQSVAVVVAAILAIGGAFVAMWAYWGMVHSRRVGDRGTET